MPDLLLSLKDIKLTFGGTPLLEGASLTVEAGAKICLVGRNGCGKSTLLKIAARQITPDSGEIFRSPNARIEYLPQEVIFNGIETTLEFVEAGLAPTGKAHHARRQLEKLGLTGSESTAQLSGGEARRAAIARALASSPDLLLLDEPTNHLDLPCIEWLENELLRTKSAIVLISHDRQFLEKLTRQTVWLDRGTTRIHPHGFANFEEWRDEILEQEDAERHKLDRKILREESWMYSGGVTGRRRRNMRRVAELSAMRKVRRDAQKSTGKATMVASEASASGRRVILAENIVKRYGTEKIVEAFSIRIDRGDRVGIIGPNGAGKSTLLSMLIGKLPPDQGKVSLGTNLEIVFLDQNREVLEPDETVSNTVTRGHSDWVEINGHRRHVASYLKDFLFLPEQTRSPVKVLSGGEKARLLLARALATSSNLMVLDEPTNDLDIETLDLLQELIADYHGTVLLVSHDRDFLDRVVTSVIASDGEGRWIEYAGGYSDMLSQRRTAIPSHQTDNPNQQLGISGKLVSQNEPVPQQAKRKLSFKEKHALETLPSTIAGLNSEISRLENMLADTKLYSMDPRAFNEATKRLSEIQTQLAEAEEQWLELEILRETLEIQTRR